MSINIHYIIIMTHIIVLILYNICVQKKKNTKDLVHRILMYNNIIGLIGVSIKHVLFVLVYCIVYYITAYASLYLSHIWGYGFTFHLRL